MVLVNSHRVEGKAKYQDIGITNLLASIFFSRQLHLAHAPGTDCLTQYPLSGLGGDSRA